MEKITLQNNGIDLAKKHPNHKEFRRPLLDILEDLKKPVAKRFVKYKTIKGNRIEFISWYTLTRLLDYYTPGLQCFYFYRGNPFSYNYVSSQITYRYIRVPSIKIDSFVGWDFIVETTFDGKKVAVIGKLTIKAAEGDFTRCATGNENSDLESWGDPYINSEAQAFKRCCARFGLGLHLWEK
ncbi:MAG: hypothetical protein QNJ54_22890 [Prochloraceae cyanobacterium]|nr:hypothetical protein [Prochloraceae cyanobacterium]